jgi:hypothetical protein
MLCLAVETGALHWPVPTPKKAAAPKNALS